MQNTPTPQPTGPQVPSVAQLAQALTDAISGLQAADRATAQAVVALSDTLGTGICEKVEGLSLDLFLANALDAAKAAYVSDVRPGPWPNTHGPPR